MTSRVSLVAAALFICVTSAQLKDQPDASGEKIRTLQTAEWFLASALAGAKSWTLTLEEQARLAARCSDGGSCGSRFGYDSSSDPPLALFAPRPRIGHERLLDFFIEGYSPPGSQFLTATNTRRHRSFEAPGVRNQRVSGRDRLKGSESADYF